MSYQVGLYFGIAYPSSHLPELFYISLFSTVGSLFGKQAVELFLMWCLEPIPIHRSSLNKGFDSFAYAN